MSDKDKLKYLMKNNKCQLSMDIWLAYTNRRNMLYNS